MLRREDHARAIAANDEDRLLSCGRPCIDVDVRVVDDVPDERWGETVMAIIVAKPGSQPERSEIVAFCRDRVASYKKPRRIEFVAELPVNSIGKIDKGKLRERFWRDQTRQIHERASSERRPSMRRSVLASALAALLLVAGGVRPAASQQAKVYTFGAMFPLTGPAAEIGELFERGLNMAVDEINARGVDGWKLKAVIVDHKGMAQGGVTAMNQLVNLDRVPFVITSFTAVGLAAQPIAAQNQVLLLNVGGTSNNLLNKPWLYNNQVMAGPLNEPLARYAYGQGMRTAALLTSDDAYGRDDGDAFSSSWTSLGGKVVDSETFPLSTTDFTAQLSKIRAANPQVLYVVAVGDTQGLLVKQARALGITAKVVGPLATAGLIKVGGNAADGFIDTGIAVDPTTSDRFAKTFLNAYKAKYGTYPEWDSGTSYEAVYLLASLIHSVVAAKGDPRNGNALLSALEAHPTFQNYLSGGRVQFLKDHGSTRGLAVQEVKDGKFMTLRVVKPPA